MSEMLPRITNPAAFKADWDNDSFRFSLDARSIQEEMAKALREADDKMAEPVVIEWLRSRGFSVEKLTGPLSVECPNCQARVGDRCTVPTNISRREWRGERYHDARRDRAEGLG